MRFTVETLRMLSGLLIWAAHFLFILLFTALVCARRLQDMDWLGVGIVTWGVGLAGCAAIAGIVAVAGPTGRRFVRAEPAETPRFMAWMTLGCAALALVGVVWETLPLLWVPVCP